MRAGKYLKYRLGLFLIALSLAGSLLWSRSRVPPVFVTTLAEAGDAVSSPCSASQPLPVRSAIGDLSPGELHCYGVTLNTGQYLRLFVQEQGIQISVALYGPDNQALIQQDCRHRGPTPLSVVAQSSGVYRVELRSREKASTRGRYELTVKESRPALPADNHRITAEKVVAEAEQFATEEKAESTRAAIEKFKEALVWWKTAGDRGEEGRILRRIADVSQPLGKYETALSYYNQALSLARRTGNRQTETEILDEIGYVYITLGEIRKALDFCSRALARSRDLGDRWEEARALNNLGEVYYGLGELPQSLDHYRQSLRLWQELGDRRGLALTYLNFGYTYSDQGNASEALDSFNLALSTWEAVNDRRGQALTLTALGRFYSRTGESQKALEFFARSKDLIHLIGDPIEEARTLNGIAYVYDGLGDGKRALEHYERALPLFRTAKYPNGEAATLGDIGKVYQSLGENEKALDYHQQAIAIFRAVGDHRMETSQLQEIGRIYEARGDKTEALENYLVARALYRTQRDLRGEAVILNLIGSIYERLGQRERALGYYSSALRPSQESKYRFAEASTLYNIARLERDGGNLSLARTRIEAALALVESIRTKVASQDLRSSYFAGVRQYYELYIDTLMQAHKQRPAEGLAEAAFDVSEKARARSLLELLTEARANIRQGVDPALLNQERSLQQALNSKAERQIQLLAGRQKEQAEIVAREIDQLTMQYDEIAVRIRSASPRYADLMQPQPLNLKAVQQMLLDDNTLLLEYMLGDDRSYLWAVTRSEVSSYELAGRRQIEDAARSVHQLLTANQPVPGEAFEQREARIAKAKEELPNELANLSSLLLTPVASKLGTKRLLIVPDGMLQYIPFQVLTAPAEVTPLVTDHEIINEPSASALALLRGQAPMRKHASKTVAVLADPVFDADDSRITSRRSTALPKQLEQTELQAFRDPGFSEGGSIPRLPATRQEADAIVSVAPWWSSFKAIGFEASRATAMRPDLGDYRIVHFATHGFLNDEHPELSGIVLSLFDDNGQPQEGFLRLHDIYNLELPVDLVVLSACNTGLGKDVKGEGLVGLTRGFMYAGAASVVASLWKVDDEATGELMRYFYGFMLKDDLAPAAALRKAQLTMSQQKRWHSPYYWSAFIIQGQYTQNTRPDRFGGGWALWVCVIAVAGIAVIFALRRRRIWIH